MTRWMVAGALVLVGTVSITVAGSQQTAPRAVLPDLQKVKDNFYIVASSSPLDRSTFTGGNTGVFIGDTGVVVVDTKLAGYGADLLTKIRAVTSKPVTTIINTHTHGDHTGSNEGFPATVEIVAHENTKALMANMDAFKAGKAQFLPRRTFKDKLSIGSGKDRIDLYYFGPGHTSGDTWVVFPSLKILQTGDMFAWKDAPFLDRTSGGSGLAFPRTLANAIGALKDVDTVIPGHSAVMTPKDLQEYQRYMTDLVAAVQAAKQAGKSAADAAASIDLGSRYPGYRSDRLKAAVESIYAELQ